MNVTIHPRPLAGALLSALLVPALVHAAPRFWDGDCEESFWDSQCQDPNDPNIPPRILSNWDDDDVPLPGDDITINSPGEVVDANVSVNVGSLTAATPLRVRRNLTAGGPVVMVAGVLDLATFTVTAPSLSLNGESAWLGGDIEAPTFQVNGTLNTAGNGARLLNGTSLTNAGTVNFGGTRQMRQESRIDNAGTWHFDANNAEVGFDGTVCLFTNTGTLRKSGAGIAGMAAPFLSDGGSIEVVGGTFGFEEDTSIEGGTIAMQNDASLAFLLNSSRTVDLRDTAISGEGDVRFAGLGEVTFEGTVSSDLDLIHSSHGLYFDVGSTVELRSNLSNLGLATWQGTEVTGDAVFDHFAPAMLRLEGAGSTLSTTLRNAGQVIQEVPLTLEGAQVQTRDNGIYRIRGTRVIDKFGTDNGFEVLGGSTLEHPADSPADSEIQPPVRLGGAQFYIIGTIDARARTLSFTGGGVINRVDFEIAEGARVRLASGTYEADSINVFSKVGGRGELVVSTGAVWGAGPAGGELDNLVATTLAAPGAFVLDGGTLSLEVGNRGEFRWRGGTIESAVMSNTGNVVMEGSGSLLGTVRNATKDHLWTHQSGVLTIGPDGYFENVGIYEMMDGAVINGTGTFANHEGTGSLVSRGNTRISCPFRNIPGPKSSSSGADGAVFVMSGTLNLNGEVADLQDGVLDSGRWRVEPGATLLFPETIDRIGNAEVINYGSIPALGGLAGVGTLGAFENFGDFSTQQSLENGGRLNNSGYFEAPAVINEEEAEVESVIPFLREAIVNAIPPPGDGPAPAADTITYEEGFIVPGGFTNHGVIHPGGRDAAGYLPVDGSFTQTTSAVMVCDLAGPTNAPDQAAGYDQTAVLGPVQLGGLLVVRFIGGFEAAVSAGHRFVIVQGDSIAGQFANAGQGARLHTADGAGSFLVSYGATEVTLSDFMPGAHPQPAAEPAIDLIIPAGRSVAELTGFGSPGREYVLERSDDLMTFTPFASLYPNASGRDREIDFDLGATGYYRLRRR